MADSSKMTKEQLDHFRSECDKHKLPSVRVGSKEYFVIDCETGKYLTEKELNESAHRVITFRQMQIEAARDELRRWESEKVCWCAVLKKVARESDSCEHYESNGKAGILIPQCTTCKQWSGG